MLCLKLRYVTKPIKRAAFAKGRSFTTYYAQKYVLKYLMKFLRKRDKIASPNDERYYKALPLQQERLGKALRDVILSEKKSVDVVHRVIKQTLLNEKSTSEDQQKTQPISAAEEEFVIELADYAIALGAAVDKNNGLDHSKVYDRFDPHAVFLETVAFATHHSLVRAAQVREYWLNRGPRLFATMLFFTALAVCTASTASLETLTPRPLLGHCTKRRPVSRCRPEALWRNTGDLPRTLQGKHDERPDLHLGRRWRRINYCDLHAVLVRIECLPCRSTWQLKSLSLPLR